MPEMGLYMLWNNYILAVSSPSPSGVYEILKEDVSNALFGLYPDSMVHWTEVADEFNFVLMILEGLEQFFDDQTYRLYAL
jgi:hypothetical protein